MTTLAPVVVTMLAAAAGVAVARLACLPGATLLGALAGAAIARFLVALPPLPGSVGVAMQVLVGAAIGVRLGPAVLHDARRWGPSFGAALVGMLAAAAIGAWLLTVMTDLSWRTSALAALPGGAADATALAIAAEQDGATVATIHLTRQLLVLGMLAAVLRWATARRSPEVRETDVERRSSGAVVWRRAEEGREVLLVHRPRYDDWSLPKGGIEPGETPRDAAVREALEETGWWGCAGDEIGTSRLRERRGPHGSKHVTYFAVEARSDRGFVPSSEVDAVRWYPLGQAIERCSRPQDREVLRSFDRHLRRLRDGTDAP